MFFGLNRQCSEDQSTSRVQGLATPYQIQDASIPLSLEGSSERIESGSSAGLLKAQNLPRPTFSDEISLGETVVRANGLRSDGAKVVITQNFIPSLSAQGGVPIQIDAVPDDNKSANQLAIPCLGANEVALVTIPAPGLIEYYQERGLLESSAQVLSFNGQVERGKQSGFPGFDPVSLAAEAKIKFNEGFFVSAFTSEYVRDQALAMGLVPVQQSNSLYTNDKVAFTQSAEKYGYTVAPHVELKSNDDVLRVVQEFRTQDVWIKFSHAFGGDLLVKAQHPVTVSAIQGALSRMRGSVRSAMDVNRFPGLSGDDIWPSNDIAPKHYGVIAELDARWIAGATAPGTIVCTGSNLMEVRSDGQVHVHGNFEQIVGPSGDFWGSRSLSTVERFGKEIAGELDRQFQAIGRYCANDLQLFGLVGVDFLLIKTLEGEIKPVMVELNGRPPISACSHIVGTQKLGAPAWISRYVWAPEPLSSFQDFEKLMVVDGYNFTRGDVSGGIVTPMYLASVFEESSGGLPASVLVPKRWAQVLIAAESSERCEEICTIMEQRKGLQFTRTSSGDW